MFVFLFELFTNQLPLIKRRKCLYCFVWFLLYYLLHFFQPILLRSPHKFIAMQIVFFFNIWIFEIHPRRRMFCNVNLDNLVNFLQRNVRKGKTRECIFRAFGGTNKVSSRRQPLWRLRWLNFCTGLSKKSLDTSLSKVMTIKTCACEPFC